MFAELEHVQPGARFGGPMQRPRIRAAQLRLGGEDVVERAVDHRVEPAVEAVQLRRVGQLEIHRHPGRAGVGPGPLDGGSRAVDPGRRKTLGRIVNRVMTRAGAGVEHLTLDRAERDELADHRLRAADVPRRGGG
ncbi:hypothetical protein MOKP118_31760 [Mycobacterium avium subsp. hominissuis]